MRPFAAVLIACSFHTLAFGQDRDAGLFLLSDAELHLSPGSLLTVGNGTLLVRAGARLQNQGLVQVNGAVTLDGDYATFIFGPLPGLQFGQVQSAGLTELDGGLSAKLVGDYNPGPDTRFDLFTANPVSGTFAAEDLPAPEWSVAYTTNFVSLSAGSVFPVTWLHFTGRAVPQGARLDWATASEHGSDFFGVERLYGEVDWREIARIPAAGDSEVRRDYTYLDPVPGGTQFYRLRQTDRDGAYTYSDAIAVRFGHGEPIGLYPNPTTGTLYLTGCAAGQPYRITDVHGRTVADGRIPENSADGIQFPSDLPSGLYLLHPATGSGLRFTFLR